MNPNQSNTQTEKKQFRLVKFFAYASFIVLLLFCFPFSVLLSQNAKDILMKSYEAYAILLGENLNHQVIQNFALPAFKIYGAVSLRQKEQQEWLDKVVKNTVHGFKIDRVNIYDMEKGRISYSTDKGMLGERVIESLGYKKAVQGEHFSGLISGGSYLWGLGIEKLGAEKKLRTYLPLREMNPITGKKSYVMGILELTQDLTQEYRSVIKFQYFIFGLSILIMALIFLALLLIVHRAERIIEKRGKEQLELEAQLNQAERLAALGQMIAGVSHEIRNPLGIIRSTAELLAGMEHADETQKKLSNMIIDASSRLNNIVTEFIDFARPQTPNCQECFLEEILNNVLNFMEPELEKEKVIAHHNLTGRGYRLHADPHLLYRAFLNLLLNAVQAMNDGGDIWITVKEDRDNYLLDIRDSGEGISEETLSKVFSPFYSTKDIGSGLGLPIVRNIIESHNGGIWIESAPGSGTQVNINLPKA